MIMEVWGFLLNNITRKPASHFLTTVWLYWLAIAKPKNDSTMERAMGLISSLVMFFILTSSMQRDLAYFNMLYNSACLISSYASYANVAAAATHTCVAEYWN